VAHDHKELIAPSFSESVDMAVLGLLAFVIAWLFMCAGSSSACWKFAFETGFGIVPVVSTIISASGFIYYYRDPLRRYPSRLGKLFGRLSVHQKLVFVFFFVAGLSLIMIALEFFVRPEKAGGLFFNFSDLTRPPTVK
jgi:hypothetical protein